MRTLIGLAAVLHVATAEAECSDPFTCGQRASLMQMKSVNTKQSNDGSMHSTLMYFQTFTQKLVQQFNDRRAAQAPTVVHDGILETDEANTDHIARDANGKKKFVKLDDATHAQWTTSPDNTYDKTTLDTVRNVMDTIRQTLLGALIQNLDNALVRVGQCQLLEAYDGQKLKDHKGYHVGYFDPLPGTELNPGAGYPEGVTPRVRRMRRRIQGSTDEIRITNRVNFDGGESVEGFGSMDGLTFDQRAMGEVETVHQFCFKETFTETDLSNLEKLWGDSETKRGTHKTCRMDRVSACVGMKKPNCEAYDNYRWYDPAARLETHQCHMFDNDPNSNTVNTEISVTHASMFRDHLAATDDRKVNKMEECLRGTKTWLEDLYTYYKNCNREGTDECLNQRETCDAKQHDFEVARCWWAVDHDYHCTSYEHCVKNRLTACVGVCEDLKSYLESTKRDYSTGETIQCLLEALFGRYNTAYTVGAKPYLDAAQTPTDTVTDTINPVAWPLIPRGETDDEKKEWLDWCSGAHSDFNQQRGEQATKSAADVLGRYYHNNLQEYPWYAGSASTPAAGGWESEVASLSLVSFAQIKGYEADYFTVRCRGGSRLRNARRHNVGNVVMTHEECSGPEAGSDPWECFEAFTSHSLVDAHFGLDRSIFSEDATWSWDNPEEAGASKYDRWPERTTNLAAGMSTAEPKKRPTENSGMGTVLYLTYLAKFHELPSFVSSSAGQVYPLFDCSQEPVPGEWGQSPVSYTTGTVNLGDEGCNTPPPDDSAQTGTSRYAPLKKSAKNDKTSQALTNWPHFGCFADVYRVDTLRTDVPACDIDVEIGGATHKTFWLSHASNLKYGVVDNSEAGNPDGLGCGNAQNIQAGTVSHDDRKRMKGVEGFSCNEYGHSVDAGHWEEPDDSNLYGTCCAPADEATANFWEPIPQKTESSCNAENCAYQPRSEYNCKNHYMFTYAERELALGLKGLQQGFHDDSYADKKGFFQAQRHTLIADTYRESVTDGTTGVTSTVHTTASLAGAGIDMKSPWSISSDIQGAYRVVSTTASLGTSCTFRHQATSENSAKYVTADGEWNADSSVSLDEKTTRPNGPNGGVSGVYRYQDHSKYTGAGL